MFALAVTMATAQTTPPPATQNGDVLSELVGSPFRTSDRNNNECVESHGGPGWFDETGCARLNLFGDYSQTGRKGVWFGVPLPENRIVKMEMKIRPVS